MSFEESQTRITQAAMRVEATEAAAFAVFTEDQGYELTLRLHLRPDDSSPTVRDAAVRAFKEIITMCLERNQDGCITVDEGAEDRPPQFCLVAFSRVDEFPIAAYAFIVHADSEKEGQTKLEQLRLANLP